MGNASLAKRLRVGRTRMVTWFTGGGNPAREHSIPGTRPGWKVRCTARGARPKSDMVKAKLLETQFPGLNPPGYTKPDWIRVLRELTAAFADGCLYSLALSQRRRSDVKETNGNLRHSLRTHCQLNGDLLNWDASSSVGYEHRL